MNMPHPNGCYVKVYDAEGLSGTADFINGPQRYASLTDLPNRANWAKRIRSAQIGAAASVRVWTENNFSGEALEMGTDRTYLALTDTFSGADSVEWTFGVPRRQAGRQALSALRFPSGTTGAPAQGGANESAKRANRKTSARVGV
jgi:hypothetical protein